MTPVRLESAPDKYTPLYHLGLVLIPFDNLAFAPSSGWATISPFLFLFYTLFAGASGYLPRRIGAAAILVWLAIVLHSLSRYFVFGAIPSNVVGGFGTLALGLSFLLALWIRYGVRGTDPRRDLALLVTSYWIAFGYGLIRHFAVLVRLDPLLSLFRFVEKRSVDRVSFAFAEPSFTTVHMFGVLFPYAKAVTGGRLPRNVVVQIVCFSGVSILTFSSFRAVVDVVAVIAIVALLTVLRQLRRLRGPLRHWLLAVILPVFLVVGLPIGMSVLSAVPRVAPVVETGIYGDPSLASRFFRIDAAISGLRSRPLAALAGTGVGNAHVFLHAGFDDALSRYGSAYLSEVRTLRRTNPDQLFSLPIRVVSEAGALVSLLILLWFLWYTRRWRIPLTLVCVVLWIYVQFDSYAFYGMWLLIAYPLIRRVSRITQSTLSS